jgi:hypothetical protein
MLRARLSVLALVPVLAFAACGGEKTSNESERGEAQQAMPVNSLNYIGTFATRAANVGDFTQLVLKTDGTYHRAMRVACFREPCDAVEKDGRYRFSSAARSTTLEFYQTNSEEVERYEYWQRGDTMGLHAVGRPGEGFSMQRAPAAWCARSEDCGVQNLPTGPCAGQYVCGQNICTYLCGPSPEIAGATPKVRSGS